MTGYEHLQELMKQRGCNKSQIESNTAKIVLEILATESGIITTQDVEYRKETEQMLKDIRGREVELQNRISRFNWEQGEKLWEIEKKHSELDRKIEQLKDLESRVLSAETSEMRDRMRAAEKFKEDVRIKSVYDNTAYINALGNILGGWKEKEI